MTRANDELAITGIGMISPIGCDAKATMESLLRGKSGVTLLPEDQRSLTPVYLHAPVDDAALTRVTKPESFRFDRSVHLALQAAREAWEDAGSPAVDSTRLAVLIGSGMGGLLKAISTHDRFQARGYTGFPANTVPGLMPNASAALIAFDLGAHGGAVSLSSACAAGAEAIAHALRLFRTDEIDVAVVGGTEAIIHPLTLTSFAALRALPPATMTQPAPRGRSTGAAMASSWARARACW
jgi:3-oxoacyl-[acyl-carrier-protein] synthase II